MTINQEFKKRFDEFAEGHYEIRNHLLSLQGIPENPNLTDHLQKEVDRHKPCFNALSGELGQIAAQFSEEEKEVHKNYVHQTQYYEYAHEAPFYRQIITKPNGYAGDAEMMQMIYRDDFEGETPFGKFFHKYATSSVACQAVRNRKDFLMNQIQKLESGKVLSLAAGPAEEIMAFLSPKCGGGG